MAPSLVWVDGPNGYLVVAEVVDAHAGGLRTLAEGIDINVSSIDALRPVPPFVLDGIADMTQLPDLHIGALLQNLRARYVKNDIYTYTGSILVSINPYTQLDIYDLDTVRRHQKAQSFADLPPHIFAVTQDAHAQLMSKGESQCMCISGESGAGKTEATKLALKFLAASAQNHSSISERIIETSPILESFGNAKTVRNDNSSRFGKYIELQIDSVGTIHGAIIYDYLLEKSRVVHQGPSERNYHVFYEMCAGIHDMNERAELGLIGSGNDSTACKAFVMLGYGACHEIHGKKDSEDWFQCTRAFEVIGFSQSHVAQLTRVLAGILHLGNIAFDAIEAQSGMSGSILQRQSAEAHQTATRLLGIRGDLAMALTHRTTTTRGEEFVTPLTQNEAERVRDALAKSLYARMFAWVLRRVNEIVCEETRDLHFGVLDIFGFENFEHNSFEQLCINYANETLQLYFNDCVFKLEQEAYAQEGIVWSNVEYVDNRGCLELIHLKPIGILPLLDEECSFPKGSDQSFVQKIRKNVNAYMTVPRSDRAMTFNVRHFAGEICYRAEGFLERNRDTLQENVMTLMMGADGNTLVTSELFPHRTASGRPKTVGKQFHESLTALIDRMRQCHAYFVRCIKPNLLKAASNFNDQVVMDQLRYTGMLETIRIRRAGFPIRMDYRDFEFRYRVLVGSGSDAQQKTKRLMVSRDTSGDSYRLGHTKVFLRELAERELEKDRAHAIFGLVAALQAWVRRFLCTRKYARRKVANREERETEETREAAFAEIPLAPADIEKGHKMPAVQRLVYKIRQRERDVAELPHGDYSMFQFAREHFNLYAITSRSLNKGSMSKGGSPSPPPRRRLSLGSLVAPHKLLSRQRTAENKMSPPSRRGSVVTSNNVLPEELIALTSYSMLPLQRPLLRQRIRTAEMIFNDEDLQRMWPLSVNSEILLIMGEHESTPAMQIDAIHRMIVMAVQHPIVVDELFCQVLKQLTRNTSIVPRSEENAWMLLLALVTFLKPGAELYPFLRHFVRGTFIRHSQMFLPIAALVEQHLVRVERCGPRKMLPNLSELAQVCSGTFVRRTQIFFPGDTVVENEVNAVTTAQDVVDDICDLIGAFDPLEYGLFVRTGKGKMMPLRPSDYLIDAIRTLELRNIKYRLYFRKVLWYSPISLENDLHVELLQEQAMEDYTKAALISFQEPRWTEADIVFLAAAQFSVSPISRVSQVSIHDIDEDALVESVPKCVRHLLTPLEWTQRIIAEAESLEASYKADVQRLYLETIIDLFPMYGSSFFPVSECSDQRIRGGRCLLAVDRNGVYFLDKATKVVLFSYPFNEIMSTRRLGSYNDERHYVDLKVGTLVTQKAIRIETPHALLFTTVITRYIQKHIQAARGE